MMDEVWNLPLSLGPSEGENLMWLGKAKMVRIVERLCWLDGFVASFDSFGGNILEHLWGLQGTSVRVKHLTQDTVLCLDMMKPENTPVGARRDSNAQIDLQLEY